jgi:hypothetical protein
VEGGVMGLMATDSGGTDFEPTPTGTHHAVCYAVIDVGTQPSNNPAYSDAHKCIIMWELPDLRIEIERDGEKLNLPRVISREFTISLHTKSLMRPFLESWRGVEFSAQDLLGFDISKLIGANCLLSIIHKNHNNKTYANVASASPLISSMQKRTPENPTIFYSIEDHGFSVPDTVPDWIKKKIFGCREFNEEGQQNDGPPPGWEEEYRGAVDDGPDDGIPF